MPSRRRSSSVRRSRAGQKLSLPRTKSRSSTKRRRVASSSPSGSTKRRRVASSSPRRNIIRKPMTSRLRNIRGVSAYLRRMKKI